MSNFFKNKKILLGMVLLVFLLLCISFFLYFFLPLSVSSEAQSIEQNLLDTPPENFSYENSTQKVLLSREENIDENKINQIEVSTRDSYYIKVNILTNTVNIYKHDITGNYLVPFKVFICSIGEDTPLSRYLYH